ncbi:MAG: sensor histidine kinase [Syntrophothermus sp.]
MNTSFSAGFIQRSEFYYYFSGWVWIIPGIIVAVLVSLFYELRISRIKKSYMELQEQILQRTNELKAKEIQLSKINSMQSGLLKDLWESKRRLKQINDNKDKFFSIVSHDLKSPFNSLLGFSELMLKEFDYLPKDELKEYVSSINKSVNNVYGLLENLLEWSRMQTGRMEFKPVSIELSNLIHEAFFSLSGNAYKKNIKLISHVKKNVHAFADINMIRSVVNNLISNAIKFTGCGGEIIVMAAKVGEAIEISVSDTGVGMGKEEIAKLFRIDVNFSKNGTENEKGTGLGLVLCRELVEKNGGKISVESFEGKGTTFVFTLPEYTSKAAAEKNLQPAQI